MGINTVIFIIMSLLVFIYIFNTFRNGRKIAILWELFFLGIYACVFVYALFPNVFGIFEGFFGISNILNFMTYLAIFLAYFLIFLLYQKDETQRVDISKLNRELALLKKQLEDNKVLQSSKKSKSKIEKK